MLKEKFSSCKALNFLLVGVGGQGTILASDIVAELGVELGYDVKKAEVHGMSQRGGSVVSHVRWGETVFSPTSSVGDVDVLMAFEKLEAARYVNYLNAEDGVAFINDYSISPITVNMGVSDYPNDSELKKSIGEKCKNDFWVNCLEIAETLGNVKTANVVLLGALAKLLKADQNLWFKVIQKRVPEKHVDINIEALKKGMSSVNF